MADIKFSNDTVFEIVTVPNGDEMLVGLNADGDGNAKMSLDTVKGFVRPYVEFEAIMSQAGTDDPVITTPILNEFGAMTLNRETNGIYSFTGVFPGEVPTVNSDIYGQTSGTWRLGKNSGTVLLLETSSGELRNAGAYADSKLTFEHIKFRMYLP